MSVPEVKGNIVALVYNFIKDPIGFLDQQFEEKGDVVKLKLVLKNFHATRNPKWMDHVFVKNHKNYEKDYSDILILNMVSHKNTFYYLLVN